MEDIGGSWGYTDFLEVLRGAKKSEKLGGQRIDRVE
ncbi:plasmid pRiA4b ORF-3 family protein [Cryomorpha ignava]|uniref:Plasmid pRiA4b ORF-3 family protein n=1 Tax=Cryomorpha ignava TaxID=101383 RepID=A0A7K3WMR3_9FLAO|nr:plasmid pRiA4b ORF-3 family protein [Cryomorpha ignava]